MKKSVINAIYIGVFTIVVFSIIGACLSFSEKSESNATKRKPESNLNRSLEYHELEFERNEAVISVGIEGAANNDIPELSKKITTFAITGMNLLADKGNSVHSVRTVILSKQLHVYICFIPSGDFNINTYLLDENSNLLNNLDNYLALRVNEEGLIDQNISYASHFLFFGGEACI